MSQKFEDLVLVKNLQTLACFTIAKGFWSHRVIKHRIDACLRAHEYRNGNTCFSRVLDLLTIDIHELAKLTYPIVPIFFKQSISEIINFIGEDIFDWIIVSESHQSGIIQEMIIWNVRLTPFHTVDRIKSGCLTQRFNFASRTLCECCYRKYVEKRWNKLDADIKEKFQRFFGDYKFHAIAYWKCYVHVDDYSVVQEKIIVRNRHFFENYTPLENIFKISVYCGYDVAVVHYWEQMTNEQRANALNALLCKKYSPVSKLEAWMERWTDERVTSKAQISTFCFIWNQLPEFYRRKLMLFSYWSVFILTIRWYINDTYFSQVFDSWRPMFISPRYYERTLRVAASNISKSAKHRKIFDRLWRPVDNLYSNEEVAEFIWKYLTVYEEIDSAAFIINKFNHRRKIQIMASLGQMLQVYNVNQKYHTQLQDCLSNEISFDQHTIADDIIVQVENEQPRQDVQNHISFKILFIFVSIYLLFIIICIMIPSPSTPTRSKRFSGKH